MMMKLLLPLFVATILFTPLAWSQCAPGVPSAGNPGCIPQDRPDSPYFQGNPDQLNSAENRQQIIWSDRWGAIAADTKNGKAGASVGQNSKSMARKMAMDNCAKNGGSHCELLLTYHNQCAAVAYGNGFVGSAGSPTQKEAEELAVKTCAGEDCKVVYSACSTSERVQ